MTDDICIGGLDGLTVGEAACPDDAVVFGTGDADKNDHENRSLAAYPSEPNP